MRKPPPSGGGEFTEKFVEKKGDGFVYLGYENGRVKFLCKKHNIISCKTPSHVLRHVGCIECGEEKRKQWRESQNQKTKENFIIIRQFIPSLKEGVFLPNSDKIWDCGLYKYVWKKSNQKANYR